MSGILPAQVHSSMVQEMPPCWKPNQKTFQNRSHAGRLLGEKLLTIYGKEELKDAVVFGVVRGGIPLAEAVVKVIQGSTTTENLHALIVRKIPALDNKEMAIGSMREDLTFELNPGVDGDTPEMQANIARVRQEIEERIKLFRNGQPFPDLTNKIVVVVDDGLASGRTMQAAVNALRKLSNSVFKKLIISVPVSSLKAEKFIKDSVNPDEICVHTYAAVPPGYFWDIDDFYESFPSTKKEEVTDIMNNRESLDRKI